MKNILLGASALALLAGGALAGGIERTTQSPQILFEEGNRLEISYGQVSPSLTGTSLAVPGLLPADDISNVGEDYTMPSAALKLALADKLDLALIFDKPYGADVAYEASNPMLGGTNATASTTALTALLRYKLTDRFSAFGGVRSQTAEGRIELIGAAYGPVSGYTVELDRGQATGYVLGAAYEIPDIALRVALSYNSEISHDLGTTESGPLVDPDGAGPTPALPLLNGASTTEIKTPASWNLEFQSGIAANTLLFGSVRHVQHSTFRVDPAQFVTVTGGGLIDLEDTTTYNLGVGRRFTDKFAGSLSFGYEAEGDELVSPLAPSTGRSSVTLGGSYDLSEALTLSAGVNYSWLGDAMPETGTPDTARAEFTDNNAMGVGVKIALKF